MSTETEAPAGAARKRPAKRPARRNWILLAAILLAGLLLRVSYLREVTSRPIFSAPIADAAFHDYWARAIVSGDWTPPAGEPDPRIREVPYLRPPGYPHFLALEYALTGMHLNGARVLQMLLGLANVLLMFLLGRAVFNRPIGILLAAFGAIYWALIYYEAELHSVVLSVTLGLGLILGICRNCVLFTTALTLLSLAFGKMLVQDHATVANIFIYIVLAVILLVKGDDDTWRLRRKSEPGAKSAGCCCS